MKTWEDAKRELFTPEEVAAGKARVAVLTALIDARNEKKITQ